MYIINLKISPLSFQDELKKTHEDELKSLQAKLEKEIANCASVAEVSLIYTKYILIKCLQSIYLGPTDKLMSNTNSLGGTNRLILSFKPIISQPCPPFFAGKGSIGNSMVRKAWHTIRRTSPRETGAVDASQRASSQHTGGSPR